MALALLQPSSRTQTIFVRPSGCETPQHYSARFQRSTLIPLTPKQRDTVASELKRFASDLNLSDDQALLPGPLSEGISAMNARVLAMTCLFSVCGFFLSGCGGGGYASSPAPSPSPQLTPPAITSHPSSQTVAVGQTATFTAAATGDAPLTYQWQKNGSAITGATSASYTTPVVAMSDDGSIFKVVVDCR